VRALNLKAKTRKSKSRVAIGFFMFLP